MSQFLEFIKALVHHCHSQKEIDNNYLSGSLDISDLERRMQAIEGGKSSNWPFHPTYRMGAQQ
jgi:hypothetical protein